MALAVAFPLFGLNPEHFSSLNARLLNIACEQNLRNLPDSGRDSPSAGSESSGISSLVTSNESRPASVELTPISSRPETPIRISCKTQEKMNELRVMYNGRDILNLGANIRMSSWQIKDRRLPRHDLNRHSVLTNHSLYRLHDEHAVIDMNPMKCCTECGFCDPFPAL
ncbi:uncharacterized protein LOC109854488 [Pseudomyrmex gracilis]|uniref:uncharacterized protein LOC109854488 n=1 Tax=Pseudomyrmex gracilis TaxID=219809 RepID=UPI00099555BF|nr:uncharacterized protein LOC109854488 [Pseudomyrmex gracilis]XP_020283195.1 uncharacterized protein LOC109854488 [Pseudomyrmex gracilis]